MTKKEYQDYEERVAHFLKLEEIDVHSPVYDEDGDIQPFFSKSNCECCNRPIQGNRETITAGPLRGKHFEYDICVDCVYYLEHGRLDDMTMLEIEG